MRNYLLTIIALLCTLVQGVWADSAFGGGSGTALDPYLIETPQHLRQLAADVNDGNDYEGKYFKMISSFSCWIEPFTPIGGKYYKEGSGKEETTGTRKFYGVFDGNGYTINDLYIRPTEDFYGIGLFGELGYGAQVMNLTIASKQITSTIMGWGNCGAIAGATDDNVIIHNCHVKENVVVSVDPDNLAQQIKSSRDFGGIVGENGGIVSQCTSKATVTNADITDVNTLGGIVGVNAGKVWSCTFLGTVNGTDKVGGIAGDWYGEHEFDDCLYHSSPAIGAVNGADAEGVSWMGTISLAEGLTGSISGTVCYSYNNVNYYAQGSSCTIGSDLRVNGGYVPLDPQLTSEQVTFDSNNSFTYPGMQDVTVGCTYSSLKRDIAYSPWVSIDIPSQKCTGTALTPVITVTDNMTGSPLILQEGTDYSVTLPSDDMTEAGDYDITISGMGDFTGTANATFTITPLRWLGDGTEEKPYQIRSVDDWLLLASETMKEDFADTYFILMNDLDFTGVEYKMVGDENEDHDTKMFRGRMDGNGKTIDNVTYENTKPFAGLFGHVGSGAVIRNLISGSGNVIRNRSSVGGIVGIMESADVIGCTSYATVIANKVSTFTGRYAGGIAGDMNSGNITDCRNYGSVTASSRAGGIVGLAQFGSVTGCLNFAQVTAEEYDGGIVGKHDYTSISNNYYAGDCTTGGINGSDVTGQAMKGYTIDGGGTVTIELEENASIGVAYNGAVYAGESQLVNMVLSVEEGSATFEASSGTLTDNSDGTYTLTMPAEDVTITATPISLDLTLYDGTHDPTNNETINENYHYVANVTISGRTLYKDGKWNTLCLPFNVEDFSGTIFEEATVKELDINGEYEGHQTGFDASDGTLYLYFKVATEIEAGKPYLVKWADGEDITAPVFSSITINNTAPETITSHDETTSLLGNYDPVNLNAGDNTVLYLGTNNKLYYPSKARTINSFRAYFQLHGIVAGNPQSGQQSIQSFRHNLEDEATGVQEVQDFLSSKVPVPVPVKVIKNGRLYIGEYNIVGQRTETKR
ncbi:MAG: hypothetical protein II055_06505 [Prevotella sp.]|nr:hypothetical protein [Prevotella sp.]